MNYPTKVLGGVVVSAVCLFACSTDADLAGQGSQKGETGPEEPNKSEDVELGHESQPSESQPGESQPGESETPILSESEIKLDQKVIPPEVIAGSYLTCQIEEIETESFYGCRATAKDGTRLDLQDVKVDWDLADNGGNSLDAKPITPPTDSEYHRYWALGSSYNGEKLSVSMTVYDENDQPKKIAPKGIITISD